METRLSPTAVADLVSELLAAAPATPTADREVATGSGKSARRDTLDGFGLSGKHYPQLSTTAQTELALSWQWVCRVRALLTDGTVKGPPKRRLNGELRARERHLEYLLGSVFRLARQVAREKLSARYSGEIPDGLLEDVLGEAAALAIEMAGTYDPTKGPSFATWYAARLRTRVGGMASALTTRGSAPDSWRQAAKMIREIEAVLGVDLGRAPTSREIKTAFDAAAESWARGRGASTPEEIRAHLVKQGLAAASEDLEAIRSRMNGELSLDVTVGESGEDTFASQMGEQDEGFDLVLDEMSGQVRMLTLRALQRRAPEVVGASLAGLESGEGVADQAVLRELRNELCAPHAQWCGLALDPDEVDVVSKTTTLATAIAR
jgi:DNA-directed RNA polymerase specialized sigma subunit